MRDKRIKVLVLVMSIVVALMWFGVLQATASIGELEFVGFPGEVAVTGDEVRLGGWLKFNQKEHESVGVVDLFVLGHKGRIEPPRITTRMYDGDMVPITVYLEGVPGKATLEASGKEPFCPQGIWDIWLNQATPTSTPTPTETPTSTPTSTPTPTPTWTPTSTPTNTPTATPTPTATSTSTSTPEPTDTPTPTATPTWSPTPEPSPTPQPPPVVVPGAWYEISSEFRVQGQWQLVEGLGGLGWELATLPEFNAVVEAGSVLEASFTLTNTTTPPLSTLNGVVVKVWAEELDKAAERPEDEWGPTEAIKFEAIQLVSRWLELGIGPTNSFEVPLGKVAIGGVDHIRFLVKIRYDVEAGTDFVIRFNVSWREPYALEEFLPGADGIRGNEIGQRFNVVR